MRTADTLPGESNAQIISSIINLVCPQCGGRMSEFQCEGRCCRNWLAEWNGQTRPPKAPNPGEATLAGRCGELLFFAWPASENDSRVFREHRRERTSDIVSRFGSHEC